MNETEASSGGWLPDEVLLHVFSFSDVETLCAISKACCLWGAGIGTGGAAGQHDVVRWWEIPRYADFRPLFSRSEEEKGRTDKEAMRDDVNWKHIYGQRVMYHDKWRTGAVSPSFVFQHDQRTVNCIQLLSGDRFICGHGKVLLLASVSHTGVYS